MDWEYFKVIVVGQYNVGKSALINRLMYDRFSDNYELTIGVEYIQKEVITKEGTVQLQVWDSAGQEKFRSLVKMFFVGVVGVILVYSIDDKYSFLALDRWLKDVREQADPEAVYILVGSKSDLRREVDYEEGVEYMKSRGLDVFFETSAKTGNNVLQVLYPNPGFP